MFIKLIKSCSRQMAQTEAQDGSVIGICGKAAASQGGRGGGGLGAEPPRS